MVRCDWSRVRNLSHCHFSISDFRYQPMDLADPGMWDLLPLVFWYNFSNVIGLCRLPLEQPFSLTM